MESSLHQQLKAHYAPNAKATEVAVGNFRIDAVRRNGELVEIQVASLSAIRRKVERLLADGHRLRVVKPIVARRRIIRQETPEGPIIGFRWSPKRGEYLDLFTELVYFTSVFPHPKLVIEAPLVEVEEWRLPLKRKRRRRFGRDYRIKDITMKEFHGAITVQRAEDLWDLVRGNELPETFSTSDLSDNLERPRWLAQRIAYCLKKTGAVETVGRKKAGWVYRAVG